MSLGIEYKPFNKLVKKIIDNRGKTCPVVRSGFPLIATNCILNRNLYPIFENIRFVSQETYETWFRGHPEPGDMIFVLKGTPGRVNWVPDPVNFCIAQDMVAIRANEQEVYPKYLFAALRSPIIQQEIENLHVGTLIPHFKKSDFDKLFIPCPSYKMQTYIGDTYFYFSQKIDLLQRQNATLEAMAETLFRQWFIEEVQEDFRITSLSNIANFLNGLACQKYPPSNNIDKLPVLKIRELNNGISKDCDWATSDIKSEYIVKSGDVIFSWSGSLLVKIWNGEDCVLNQHLFKVTSQTYPKWFYFFWCKYHLKEFIIISESHATTMGHIKRSDLDAAEVLIPSDKRLQEMSYIMNPLWEKYITNQTQIRTLEKLRDTLLPKLMSGEVRVRVDG